MRDCPHCRLFNPDTALRCDCGFDFQSRTIERPYLSPKDLDRVEEERAIQSDSDLLGRYGALPGLAIVLWRNFSRHLVRRRVYKTES
ncbi:MAG TPA: hypothetical protein VFW44_01040 [Bryobacteraceae bacterium]|nr:hypothetical protein [Bryobacteraceae bacterium]